MAGPDGIGNGGGIARVLRGGSWNNNAEINLRSSYRNNEHPTNRNDNNGFRLVVSVGAGGKASSLRVCQMPGGKSLPGPCAPVQGSYGHLTRRSRPHGRMR